MTDRNPDDLFDALRDRLADYGQEPPAPLWASIRAQLPPPVATPRLRRRRWQWSWALLLLLLVAAVGVISWPTGHPQPTTTRKSGTKPAPSSNKSTYSGTDGTHNASTTNTNGALAAAAASRSANAPGAPTTPAKLPASAMIAEPAHAATAAASRATKRPDHAAQWAVAGPARRTVFGKRDHRQKPGLPISAAATAEPAALTIRPTASSLGSGPAGTGAHSSARSRHGATAVVTPVAGRAEKPAAPLARIAVGETSSAAGLLQTNILTTTNPQKTAGPDGLAARAVRLEPVGWPAPAAPQPMAMVLSPLPVSVVARWAVLVLAGPALTHRQLGETANLALASPNNSLPGPATYSPPGELARQERPSAGFGAQILLRRALSGRWSLSTGLGYQEYASQASTSTTNANLFLRTPAPEYVHRDTYRFLAMPVRLGYALWPAGGRLRYGLQAGADAALYLGGSTLAPNGSLTTWNRGNSPYRALSVALSAGLEVRYHLTTRLNLVAQPTATYFLTSLPEPTAGQNSRYLWGVGSLLGISFDVF